MKTHFFFSFLALVVILVLVVSCSEDPEVLQPKPAIVADANSSKSHDIETGRLPGVNFHWIVPQEADCIDCNEPPEYLSGYGGGITFGTDFQHPTTIDPTGATDGQPIVEWTYVSFQEPVSTIYFTKNGAKFALVQPKLPSPPTATQITKYFDDLNKYWDDKTGTVRPPTWPNGSSGVIEIRGMVVRDHASPSNASVVADTYVYTAPPVLLGNMTKNGYTFTLYRTSNYQSGSVTKVTVQNSASTVTSFSLTYTIDSTGNYYHVIGSMRLSNGSVISVDDMVLNAA
jgi:hypothetical protein